MAAAVVAAGTVEVAFKRETVMANREVSIPLVLLAGAALLWRRRSPLAALAVTGVALSLPSLFGDDPTFWGGLVPYLISLYSLAVHGRARWPVVLTGILGPIALLGALRPTYRAPNQVAFNVTMALAAWSAGRSLTALRERAEMIGTAAEMRLRQQELEAREGLVAERTRIARELHDIVAHQISIMVVQAGAAERMLDSDAAAAHQAMTRVQEAGRRAIADMYLMLGMLRGDEDDVDEASPPTVGALGIW